MSADDKAPPVIRQPPAAPGSNTGSGNGADTALEALIRQRKLVETPEDRPPPAPPAPAQPLP